jgi:hypothetical protein
MFSASGMPDYTAIKFRHERGLLAPFSPSSAILRRTGKRVVFEIENCERGLRAKALLA